MTAKVPSDGRERNQRRRCASFSAWVLPVSSLWSSTPAGIITVDTRADSQISGNWYHSPAANDPHGITWE